MDKNFTVVFSKPGKVIIEERKIPSPGAGQILVKTTCTLISIGTELTILSGKFPKDSAWANYAKFPFVPGYNNIGKIVEIGKGVTKDWLGKKVASYNKHTAFFITSPENVRLVEDCIPEDEAVFFTLAEIAMNGIRRSNLIWGESVVVYGLGLLGQLVVRFSYFVGARPVIGIETSKFRLEKLPDKPQVFGINPKKDDVVAKVNQFTNNRLGDIVFEITGNSKLIPEEFKVLKRQGRFVVLSSPSGPTLFDFHDLCNAPSYTIIGAHNASHPLYETAIYPWTRIRHDELFFNLIANRELDIFNLITHRIPFSEAPEMYKKLLSGVSGTIGIILQW